MILVDGALRRAVEEPEAALARAPAHPLVDVSGRPIDPATTRVALAADDERLFVRFDVASEPPIRADAGDAGRPAYEDECVELFWCEAGSEDRYTEVVVSPGGALYTARVFNPDGRRDTWRVERDAVVEGLRVALEGDPKGGPPSEWRRWVARISLPWTSLRSAPGAVSRGNLHRIARGRSTRFEALAPTFRSDPPDFHVPERFASFRFSGFVARG